MEWFRLYDEITEDPKMVQLTDQEFRVWIYLLCYLNKQEQRGLISNYYPIESLLIGVLKYKTKTVSKALDKLEKLEMIKRNSQSLHIVNWNKRQYKSDDINVYVKRHRNITRNITEIPPDTDTDTDTDNKPPIVPQKGIIYTEDFQNFWDIYPEKTGKGDAFKKWTGINPSKELVATIIQSVIKHKQESDKWQNGYIPNPSTFLNQRRWEDEPHGKQKTLSPAERGLARFLASEDE